MRRMLYLSADNADFADNIVHIVHYAYIAISNNL